MTVAEWVALVAATAIGATGANGLTAVIKKVWKGAGVEGNPVAGVVAIVGPLLLVAGIAGGGIWGWQELQEARETWRASAEERERAGVRAELTGNDGKDTARLAKICEAHAMKKGNELAIRFPAMRPGSVDFKKAAETEWRACMAEHGITTEPCQQGETGCVVLPGSGHDYGW